MNEASKAVFLSSASQDADAARRLCEAFRAAGIEVWFDQNELVGGDAWDARGSRLSPQFSGGLPDPDFAQKVNPRSGEDRKDSFPWFGPGLSFCKISGLKTESEVVQ